MNTGTLVTYLSENAARWIERQHVEHRPHALPIEEEHIARLQGHFDLATLTTTRVRRVPGIANPDFYATLLQIPIDFTQMEGITYFDTILLNEQFVPDPAPIGLLFHELVHVVQYSILGISEFARQYVRGWAENGMRYEAIPLEAMAYSLQQRFEAGSGGSLKVEEEVQRALDVGV